MVAEGRKELDAVIVAEVAKGGGEQPGREQEHQAQEERLAECQPAAHRSMVPRSARAD